MRKIHLYASFLVLSFLLVFFITGAVMIMPEVFPRRSLITKDEKIALNPEKNKIIPESLSEIRNKYKLHGKETITETPQQKIYSFKSPGYRAEVTFKNGEDSARVKITDNNMASAMNDFHRLHGYEGNWINFCWAIMYDLCCLALVVFAFTGIYLWWKLERKKLYGLIFFSVSTGLTVFAIWYLMAIG